MTFNLPLHPSKVHPLTGEPLRAIGFNPKTGAPRWPIMGGAPDPDPADPTKTDPPPADPPKTDPPKTDPPENKGFPENTPVASMTIEQQAAYWQHNSKKHENRVGEYKQALGGRTTDQLNADLEAAEKLRQQALTDQERAVEEARKEGQTSTAAELGPKSVRAAFDLLLGDAMEKDTLDSEMDLLDLSKFLTSSGDVDTAKVRAHAQKIAPSGKGTGKDRQPFDFGGGNRGDDGQSAGVAAGRELHKLRRGGKPSTTST